VSATGATPEEALARAQARDSYSSKCGTHDLDLLLEPDSP
jgi:hypothetical protein